MNTQKLILKLKSIPEFLDCLHFMQTYSFLPIDKNFVEFSQDAYYAKFNTVVGVKKHYFLLPEVTEEWPIRKIIECLEEKLKKSFVEKRKLRYVTEESKVKLLEVASVIREICVGKSFQSPLETLAFVRRLIDEG